MPEMTFTFPPDPRPDWLIVTVHAALALLSLGSIVLLIRRTCRPPTAIDFAKWFGLIILAWFIAVQVFVGQYQSQAALVMAMVVTSVSVVAILITSLRLAVGGAPEDRIAAIGCPILLFGACLWFGSPSGGHAEGSNRSQCRYNLRNIGTALWNAEERTGELPAAVVAAPVSRSWRVDLLPFLDHEMLRGQYHDELAWDSSSNEPVSQFRMVSYICPSNFNPVDDEGRRYTAYAAVTGVGTIFEPGKSRKPSEVTDGLSNTLAVIEACGQEIVWTEPRDIDVTRDPVGLNLNGPAKTQSAGWGSSYHLGGCQVLMGDGAIRWVNNDIDPSVLRSIATAAGADSINNEF